MISAIIIGRKGSKGFPNKNMYPIAGSPLAWWGMKSACDVKEIDGVFISTDDEKLMNLAMEMDIEVLHRPPHLATDKALAEDVYKDAYARIPKCDILVLLMCNAYAPPEKIKEGIKALQDNPDLDSAVTVTRYNMFCPVRATRITNNLLEAIHPNKDATCDRNSTGDVWFADMGAMVIRSRNLDNEKALLSTRWMGQKIYPLKQECGIDVDYEWQMGQMKWHINSRYSK